MMVTASLTKVNIYQRWSLFQQVYILDDPDDDGDGTLDGDEDDDGDGVINKKDADDDNDGVLDENDEL